MKITRTCLDGVLRLELECHCDDRGSFARFFCRNELLKFGVHFNIAQCNFSKNSRKGTVRGMHYQKPPYPEAKIVGCLGGRFYDVVVDIRKNSPTYLKWEAFELSSSNATLLYIPPYMAHGFQTLEDNTDVLYMLDAPFEACAYTGVRYNDPAFSIKWPLAKPSAIAKRDAEYPDFEP